MAHTGWMGTIQDPNPDRDWLKRSYVDTSNNPFSVDAQTEMMGRLAEGTGGSRAMRAVMRAVAAIALVSIAVSGVLGILDLIR
jgi:hypothetical protein